MIGPENIQSIAVVGAGTMGQGIAQVFASGGFPTRLFDIEANLVLNGIAAIKKKLTTSVEKGRLSHEQRLKIEQNIIPCYSLTEVKADLIIEAIVEKLEVKQYLFREIEKINSSKNRQGKEEVVLVTNTSSLSVTAIANGLSNPGRCVGLHFFNPAHQMKLVEVIAGTQTEAELIEMMIGLARKIGKIPVRVKDSPGFIVNRVARHYYVESLKVLEEGRCDVAGIDRLLQSAGFRMGPFELMDLIGLDTNYSVTESLHHAFLPDPKFRPSSLQRQKIEQGHLGRKTGKGFYDYTQN